ncbi:MAG: hypothetical protein ACREP7_03355 [Lysobacter sp.]
MNSSFAASHLQALQPGDADYATLIELATPHVRKATGLALTLKVDELDRQGDWAFLRAQMRTADGRRPDWSASAYAEQAAVGSMSDTYAALFKRKDDAWTLVAETVAPGDVAWEAWPQEYGAPASLFGY